MSAVAVAPRTEVLPNAAVPPGEPIPGGLAHLPAVVLDRPTRRARFNAGAFWEAGAWKRHAGLVLGTRSVYDRYSQRKLLDSTDWPVGTHELARPYLRWLCGEQRPAGGMGARRVPWRRTQLPMLDLPAPYYFPGGGAIEGDLAYVDVSACYWRLYSPATLDLEFDPARGRLLAGRVEFLAADALAESKGIRNTLMGVLRATAVQEVRFGHTSVTAAHNQFLAPCLWGYVAHTLHAIAREAILRFAACYFHTDGMIVQADRAEEVMRWLAEDWRLDARLKAQGPGRVTAIGSYQVGDRVTKVINDDGRAICNLLDLDPTLARQLQRWRHWLLDRPSRPT